MEAATRPRRAAFLLAALLVVLSVLSGCAAVQTTALRERPPADIPATVELAQTPFFPQETYQCGPAALATALAAAGLPADLEQLGAEVFLPARTGTLQAEMIAGARRHGAVATRLPPDLASVLREVQAGHPVVVLLNLGLSWVPVWHYAVVVGYDIDSGEMWLRSGRTRRATLLMRTFEHTWKRAGSWAFAALPPGQWPATAQEAAVVEAAVGFERAAPAPQAVAAYRAALARWPASLSLQMGLGNALYASGDKAGAAQAFRAAAQGHRSAPAYINLASTLLELHRRDEAVAAARTAVAVSDAAWRAQADAALAEAAAARP
jgi:hypothetical protein